MSKSKSTRRKTAQSKGILQNNSLLMAVFGLIVLVAVLPFLSNNNNNAAGGSSGDDFTATTVSGETVSLSDYRGKVVMLNFWATWCPPCRAEMPTIQEAYTERQEEGFVVLAINNQETLAEVVPFVQAYGLEFPVLLDTQGVLQEKYASQIRGYPTSIFLDGNGDIYMTHTGGVNMAQLEDYIAEGLRRTNG